MGLAEGWGSGSGFFFEVDGFFFEVDGSHCTPVFVVQSTKSKVCTAAKCLFLRERQCFLRHEVCVNTI